MPIKKKQTKKVTRKKKVNFDKHLKVTEVKVNYGMTLNLGNYESMRVDVSHTVSATVPDTFSEDEKEALKDVMQDRAIKESRKALRDEVKMIRETNKKE